MRNWIISDDLHTLAAIELSPARTVTEATPLSEVRALLVELRVPAIAVVDDRRRLRGLVTRTDVLAEPDAATAGEVMSGYVFALPLDATLEAAAALMAIEGVGQVVVVTRDGELAGMLSAFDVARHVATRAGLLAA